jgi:putative protein-disulfide isomerase
MPTLYYVHDPMCSWCWGFAPVLDDLLRSLPPGVEFRRLLGGLAPDSDVPMPEELRDLLQQTWRRIQSHIPGTEFNFDFWTRCMPRRSTYPACRAVIAARRQDTGYDSAMTRAIQRAYYLEARNPSDTSTLTELAGELGLDTAAFVRDLASSSVDRAFTDERARARALGVDSYPSLVLVDTGPPTAVPIDYRDAGPMLARLGAGAA